MLSGDVGGKPETSHAVKVRATRVPPVQEDTEVIHREVKGGTEINCYLKENQSEFTGGPVRILGNTSTEGLGKETLRT